MTVVVPSALPVTLPLASTVATFVSDDVHITAGFSVVFAGLYFMAKASNFPGLSVSAVLFTVMDSMVIAGVAFGAGDTGAAGGSGVAGGVGDAGAAGGAGGSSAAGFVTVTVQVAVMTPNDALTIAVIVAVPSAFPVTTPFVLTVAIFVSEDIHIASDLSATSAGIYSKIKVAESPTLNSSIVLSNVMVFINMNGIPLAIEYLCALDPA
jgi:hypothetical protein